MPSLYLSDCLSWARAGGDSGPPTPASAPDDLRNLKLRVPPVPLWVAMFKALGAAPVSLPLSEAYQALQTKVADGQENPLALINNAKFYEVQKYCSLTNHAWDGFWFVASGRAWKNMPAEVQQIMQKHINAAARKQRDDIVRANVDLQKALEEKANSLISEELLERILKVDCELPLALVTKKLYDNIQQLAPFGMANPEPVFVSRNIIVETFRILGKEKNHLKARKRFPKRQKRIYRSTLS